MVVHNRLFYVVCMHWKPVCFLYNQSLNNFRLHLKIDQEWENDFVCIIFLGIFYELDVEDEVSQKKQIIK